MYCNACGRELATGAVFCGNCGKTVVAAPAVAAPAAQGRVARHLQILAILWGIYSALHLVAGLAVLFVGALVLPHIFVVWPMTHLVPGLVSAVAIVLLAVSLAGLAAAWSLPQREEWARVVILILAILALLRFPFGTALGVYTLWVLFPQQAAREYSGVGRSA